MNLSNNDTHEKIRNCFLELIREKGYSKTTFKEVASVSGMTRQNLYYYYDSKEGMLQDVIEVFFDGLFQKVIDFNIHQSDVIEKESVNTTMIRALATALRDDIDIASCFFSSDVEKVFITKEVAFLKRVLGSIIRAQKIEINDPQSIQYQALQIAGACHFPIREWLLNDPDYPVEKMVNLSYPIFDQALVALTNN